MKENILNISQSNYGEYEEKLNILSKGSFDTFIKELKKISIKRNLAGMVNYECLCFIKNTLLAFDKIEFNDSISSSMIIGNWEQLRLKSNLNLTEREFYKWVYNGMINSISNIIDEDIMYNTSNMFLLNLRDFLCLINIIDKE
ncbi:hypothetical protein Q5M85_09210 [Paraclostridium bifermentans]|nr:hypothetical protein [Paraclostridium bifermentans]